VFNKQILPDTANLRQEDSSTGDSCHYNIESISNGVAKRIFTDNFELLNDGKVCDNQNPQRLTANIVSLYLSYQIP